ncbi:pyridoxamine 5'-phosphate oxidase family protein [Vibrio sp. S4M6]|uniref:HugZ family pyridoxamine 5'-phosphate oxidase n=1 Tax=Vibrio sinus TaxID=2946865 RepID=UPI00202A9AB2|nr:pyridoxamine 5'-phosphate oxidase family protein [Vibrio sinus]MCL9780932.1 pyridoxamine 5'-phosphate oxidase family protein [Vibrio sinus]
MNNKVVNQARHYMRQSRQCVISTVSKKLADYPFGSVTPFISSYEGKPIVYISDIAQHTKNIKRNNKVSLTFFGNPASTDDQNQNARVTIMGDAHPLDQEASQAIRQRFLQQYPQYQDYPIDHGFHFWQIEPQMIRYIGGFAKAYWIDKKEWLLPKPEWNEQAELDMAEHMNQDHVDAMKILLSALKRTPEEEISMTGIQPDGCYIRNGSQSTYHEFDDVAMTAAEVKNQLVQKIAQARKVCMQ